MPDRANITRLPRGSEWQARPTVYKGIRMRSRLEATTASSLDQHEVEWEYEPRCYADESGQYLPDFELWATSRGITKTFLEVKGLREASAPIIRTHLSRMSIVWSSEPTTRLVFIGTGLIRPWIGEDGEWWEGNAIISAADPGEFFCVGCDPCIERSESLG